MDDLPNSPLFRGFISFQKEYNQHLLSEPSSKIYSCFKNRDKETLATLFSSVYSNINNLCISTYPFKKFRRRDERVREILANEKYNQLDRNLRSITNVIYEIHATPLQDLLKKRYHNKAGKIAQTLRLIKHLLDEVMSNFSLKINGESKPNEKDNIIQETKKTTNLSETKSVSNRDRKRQDDLLKVKEGFIETKKELNDLTKKVEKITRVVKRQSDRGTTNTEEAQTEIDSNQLNSQIIEKFNHELSTIEANVEQRINDVLQSNRKEIAHLTAVRNEFIDKQKKLVAESLRRRNGYNTFEEKSKEILERIQKESEETLGKMKNEGLQIIGEIREASGLVGIHESSKHFSGQEAACNNRRKTWAWLIGILLSSIILFSLYIYFMPIETAGNPEVYQKLGLRIAILAILVSAATWCGRIYKALYHQELINNHKVLCLQTMNVFFNAAENQEERDAIILQATKAVFSSAPTGFIQDHTSDSDFNIFTVANQLGKASNQQ